MKKVLYFLIHSTFLLTFIGCGQKASVQFEITPPQSNNGGTTEQESITLTPSVSSSEIEINNPVTLSVSNGTAPYTLTIQTGTGTIDNTNMQITPTASGTLTIKATDANGNTGTVNFDAFETKSGQIGTNETWSGFIKITGTLDIINTSTITIAAGTKVYFEKTGGGEIKFSINTCCSLKNRLIVNGTSANPVTIKSIGTTVGYFSSNFYPGDVNINYANFTNIGSGTRDSFEPLKHNSGNSLTITNSTFTSCGRINMSAYNSATMTFSNNTISSPLNAVALQITGVATSYNGLKTISGNKIQGQVYTTNTGNMNFNNNVLTGSDSRLSMTYPADTTIENNLIYYTGTTAGTAPVYLQGGTNYTIKGNFIKGGGRLIRYVTYVNNASNNQTGTISGNIFEGDSTVPTTVFIESPGNATTIKDNYFIGNAQNASSIIQLSDGRTAGYTIRNNTFNVESSGGLIGVYSLSSATAGYIASGRNNLFIIDTGSPYGFRSKDGVAGEITSATNNYFSFAGTEYFNVSGGTTGTNDKSGSAGLQDATVTTTNFTSADAQDGTVTRASLFNTITTALTPTASSILVDAGSSADNSDPLTKGAGRDIGAGEYSP